MNKKPCQYSLKVPCFIIGDCTFPSELECLRQALFLSTNELSLVKQQRNIKHSKMSIKWRDQSFYYKKRCVALQEFIKGKGLSVPTVVESSNDPDLTIQSEDIQGEDSDEMGNSN